MESESPKEQYQMSRRSKRRLNYQRQKERIRSMESATQSMTVVSEPTIVESTSTNGVLAAMEGTVQGQTGWYQTAQGESQYWQVDETGQWSRIQ